MTNRSNEKSDPPKVVDNGIRQFNELDMETAVNRGRASCVRMYRFSALNEERNVTAYSVADARARI